MAKVRRIFGTAKKKSEKFSFLAQFIFQNMFNNILLLIFGYQTLSNLRIILHSFHQDIMNNSLLLHAL